MRHYEIVILIHPDQSEQVSAMVERYQGMITKEGGKIHRNEDWGRRSLAYPINKVYKAHYVLWNVESPSSVIEELNRLFRINDAILRSQFLVRDSAETEPSIIFRAKERAEKAAEEHTRRAAHSSEASKYVNESQVLDELADNGFDSDSK